jgi:molybdopterin molybdotransferase
LWGSKPVLALSGNPSACTVGYHLLVSPVLRQMQGLAFAPEITTAVCIDKYRKNGGIRRFLRGRMFVEEGVGKVKILPGQKSTMLRSLLSYNALIDLQAGHPPVEEESMVSVIPINSAENIFKF